MKVLLYTDHSSDSEHLARLSMQNHWAYSAKRGYDFLTVRMEWANVLLAPYARILELLDVYDVILAIGSDVLFMNFEKGVEDLLEEDDNMVVARETEGWASLFNMGVVIFCATPRTRALIDVIHAKRDEWIDMRLITQSWLNENYHMPLVRETLRLVPTRTMNSTNRGREAWQEGDWLIHFYGNQKDKKPGLMRAFIETHEVRS